MPLACPQPARWREWLADRVPAADRVPMVEHLGGCVRCQKVLDDLSGEQDQWSEAAEVTAADPAPDSNLDRALDELKAAPPHEPAWFADPLTFLKPSDHPGSLGRLGDYEVLEEVGRGGNGIVLKAFEPALHRVVAVKVMAPHLAANGSARERFLREAKAQASVVHENVVTLHHVGVTDNGLPYLVMEFVSGRSLQDRLDRDGPLSTAEVLRIGMQAAAGLAAAHAVGLVHRDVKPANILLENGVERVKLADFGLVRAADDACLTRSGIIAGSPQYMSPEQARGKPLDSRSDLFSLGSVLYTACTGRPPFRAPSPLAVLKRVCDDEPRPIRQINPDVPELLVRIIARLMAKKPTQRFPSAAEAADLFGRCLRHLPDLNQADLPPLTPVGKKEPKVSVEKPESGSNAVLWVALGLLAFLILPCLAVPVLFVFGFFMYSVTSVGPPAQVAVVQAPPAMVVELESVDPLTVLDDAALRDLPFHDYLGAEFEAHTNVLLFRLVSKKPLKQMTDEEKAAASKLSAQHPIWLVFEPASGKPSRQVVLGEQGLVTSDDRTHQRYTYMVVLSADDRRGLKKIEVR